MKSKNCKWTFAKLPDGSYGYGMQEAMGENFKKNPFISLVREAIQNSLDAQDDSSKPVEVCFDFVSFKKRDYDSFEDLYYHIDACLDEYPKSRDKIQSMCEYMLEEDEFYHCLKVSDYNTKGMSYGQRDFKAPFNAFVRSAGNSVKEKQNSGGSFGFGKAAYYNLSPIKTLLVSTMTSNGESYFEGVSMLASHFMDNQLYSHVGFYDNHDGASPSSGDDIPNDFFRAEPGTDMYILSNKFSDEERVSIINKMKEAVLRNFWLSILENKLVVKFCDDNTIINADNLDNWMNDAFGDKEDNVSDKSKYFNETYIPYYYYQAVVKGNQQNNGPVYYKFEESVGSVLGHGRLYLCLSPNAKDKILCMRQPKMLIQVKGQATQHGYYGVFICDDKNGDEILTQLENPAHNEWAKKNWKQNNYEDNRLGVIAIKELNDFIKSKISSVFINIEGECIAVGGIDEILPLVGGSIDNNPFTSHISQFRSKTISITSQSSDGVKKQNKYTKNGHLTSIVGGGVAESEEQSGTPVGTNPGGDGRGNGGNSGGSGTKVNRHKKISGSKGKHGEFIDAQFRVIAKAYPEGNYHKLVINSPNNYDKCQVVVRVSGLDSDSKISIADVKTENVRIIGEDKNVLEFNHMQNGKNVVEFKFSDNMFHGLKLLAYED